MNLELETRAVAIQFSVRDWAKKISQFLSCGNITFLNFQKITVLLQKMFFHFIIDPENVYDFFHALFLPLARSHFSVTDPLVTLILLHGKMFGCYEGWYNFLQNLRAIRATISDADLQNPSINEALIGDFDGQVEGLVFDFSTKYTAFIETSWRYENIKISKQIISNIHSPLKIKIGNVFTKYFVANVLVLAETYVHAVGHTYILAVHFVEGLIKANGGKKGEEALEHLEEWIKKKANAGKEGAEKALKYLKARIRGKKDAMDDTSLEFSLNSMKKLFLQDGFKNFASEHEKSEWKSSDKNFYLELINDGMYQNLQNDTEEAII